MNDAERLLRLRRFAEVVATGRVLLDGRWQSDYYGEIIDLPEAATDVLRVTADDPRAGIKRE